MTKCPIQRRFLTTLMSNLQLTTDILQNGAEAIGVELDQNQLSQFVEFYKTMMVDSELKQKIIKGI